MERSLLADFQGKFVGLLIDDAGVQRFRRGVVKKLTEESIAIDFFGDLQVYSLKTVLSCRCLNQNGGRL